MTTAQILFEQYKVLPKDVQQEYRKLILKDEPAVIPDPAEAGKEDREDDENSDTVRISLEALYTSIEQVKLLRQGKAELSTLDELFADVQDE